MPRVKKINRPDTLGPKIKTAQILFYLNAVIWFCLGTYLAYDMFSQNNGASSLLAGFFLYMNAAAMFFSGWLYNDREPWIFYFAIGALLVNALVTRVGQFGILDVFTLIFDVALLIFLISFRKAYLNIP
ncbi:MAG: hypothetical protein U0Z26_06210 [Anaerolineales bacterium]